MTAAAGCGRSAAWRYRQANGDRAMSVPRAGAWNSCRVTAVGVTSGRRYWAAILQPTRSTGVIRFRDVPSGGAPSYSSRSGSLGSLPTTYHLTRPRPGASPPPVPPAGAKPPTGGRWAGVLRPVFQPAPDLTRLLPMASGALTTTHRQTFPLTSRAGSTPTFGSPMRGPMACSPTRAPQACGPYQKGTRATHVGQRNRCSSDPG